MICCKHFIKFVISPKFVIPVQVGIQLKHIINPVLLNWNFQIRQYSLFVMFIVSLLCSIETYSSDREVDEGEVILKRSEGIENLGGITESLSQTESGSCIGSGCAKSLPSFNRADFERVTQACLSSLPKYCEGISTNLTKCAPDSLAILPDKYKHGHGDTYVDEAAACFSGLLVGLWDSVSFIGNALYSPYGFIMDKQYRDEALNSLSFYAEQMMTDPVETLNGLLVSPILEEIDEFASCLNWSGRWEYFCEAGVQTLTGFKVFQKAAKVAKKSKKPIPKKPISFKAVEASATQRKEAAAKRVAEAAQRVAETRGAPASERKKAEASLRAAEASLRAAEATAQRAAAAQRAVGSFPDRGSDRADTASSTPTKKSGDNPEPVQPSSTPTKKSGDNPEPVQPSSPTIQKEKWLRR